MLLAGFLILHLIQISYSYDSNPTPWLCTESINETYNPFPSCLPGYVLDIENVVYESTHDNSCSGITSCRVENKNAFIFACNRKRICQIDTNNLRFHINSTCGSTVRLFVKYRCVPVIQEQKDYLCEASTPRRLRIGDINLSCERNYRLYIKKAIIGISLKSQDDTVKNRLKCNKDTPTICNTDVPTSYHDVCNIQEHNDQCKIRYQERPSMKECPYGVTSNFSMVEYLCIPGNDITQDLPRIDICSTDESEQITTDRGLLHSPKYPDAAGQYLSCKKQLYIPRESRLRLFMLEKSLEYSHELNVYLLNNKAILNRNELLDVNLTNQIVQIELKTNHLGSGQFLLYFQIDSSVSEYAPFVLEPHKNMNNDDRRGKTSFKRDWVGILIGCLIGLLLVLIVLAIIFTIVRVSKGRRARALRYLKSDDDHRQRLNDSTKSPDHRGKDLPVEQPYLASSSPAILPSAAVNGHNRPNSASSTTSSIIIHQMNDGLSDRESLIKPTDQMQSRSNATNTDIDNFYEEIKEQQQQTALALGRNDSKGDLINPYLEAKCFEPKKNLFQGNNSSQPIRDHHESEPFDQQPSSSYVTEEQIKHKKKPPPKIPPLRMDVKHPEASAPSIDLVEKTIE